MEYLLNNYLLSIVIWLPVIIGIIILFINHKSLSYVAWGAAIINFIIALLIFKKFDPNSNIVWQLLEYYHWIPNFGINYAIAADGFSVILILLSCFINLLIFGFNLATINNKTKYMASFLILHGLMNGVFVATNAVLFYMFFEALLIPLFLIIGIWGNEHRIYVTIKFLLYASLSVILFLVAIIYLGNVALQNGINLEQVFMLKTFYSLKLTVEQQSWLGLAFLLAFAVKVPLFPLHNWLPAAQVSAPTEGSVVLAALALKLGVFGMLRFLLPITGDACFLWSKYIIGICLGSIIYASFITLHQKDLKRLIAYSSIVYMGIIVLGLFLSINLIKQNHISYAVLSINGALINILAHGLAVAALFIIVGILYQKTYSNNIDKLKGLVNSMPKFAVFMMFFSLANMCFPGTVGFIGELLIIIASAKVNYLITLVIIISFVISACYMMSTYKNIMLGEAYDNHIKLLPDLTKKEFTWFTIITLLIIIIGVYPMLIFNIINNTTLELIKYI